VQKNKIIHSYQSQSLIYFIMINKHKGRPALLKRANTHEQAVNSRLSIVLPSSSCALVKLYKFFQKAFYQFRLLSRNKPSG